MLKRLARSVVFCGLLSLSATSWSVAQALRLVPAECRTIQAAIRAANNGDTVLVEPGTYECTQALSFEGKLITVRGTGGAAQTILRRVQPANGPNEDPVVLFEFTEDERAVLQGFTLTGAPDGVSALVCNRGSSPRIVSCVVTGNGGTGVSLSDSSATLENCTISSNSGGGVSSIGSSARLIQCIITGNIGTGVFSNASTSLQGCLIAENCAHQNGGGLNGFFASITNCCIERNTAGASGGGVFLEGCGQELSDCILAGNTAQDGGGLHYQSLFCNFGLNLRGCDFIGNTATRSGGAVFLDTFQPVLLDRCTLRGNFAGEAGGGVHIARGSPSFVNCYLVANRCELRGGAIFGTGTLTNCTVASNTAMAGGGIHVPFDRFVGALTVMNSILWDNQAEIGRFHAIHFEDANSPPVVRCSIVQCDPLTPPCVDPDGDSVLVWDGEGNKNADPLFVAPGCFDFTRFQAPTGCQVQSLPDFVLEPGDFHLEPGSPAIDMGCRPDAPPIDLDGNPRPCGAAVDIGAHEHDCEAEVRFRRGDTNADERLNLTDAVVVLLHLFAGGEPPPCIESADLNDDGMLNLTDAVFGLNYLFRGGPPPAPPFPDCGRDPTPGDLSCLSFPPCERRA
jgi:parallel beta-helix repeat protein/predicted outer membrane repeat protein